MKAPSGASTIPAAGTAITHSETARSAEATALSQAIRLADALAETPAEAHPCVLACTQPRGCLPLSPAPVLVPCVV